MRTISPADPSLTWLGAIDVEHTPDWSRPWRLPYRDLDLFPGARLRQRAAIPAGVRLVVQTNSVVIGGRALPGQAGERRVVDVVVDGALAETIDVQRDGTFRSGVMPPGEKAVELWLPTTDELRLATLCIDDDAELSPANPASRPRLVVYGSSISQCAAAASPTRTWPAIVARGLGMELTGLGFGGECKLDPMVARLIRDLPADVIITCLGINVYGSGVFNERSFLPAVLGLLTTIRDGHPRVPILVISPIASPDREEVTGESGMSLAQIRELVHEAVAVLRRHGDNDLRVLSGLEVLGPDDSGLLWDGLHPGPRGYEHMGEKITAVVEALVPATVARLGRRHAEARIQ
ncbi:SGNH/GDSL hydrolase family protein [Jiangella asiatica]|uniref:GDSL family lipase n=1 Tax=Jiangella asiatica TaxID=2530372 RepID=A0A4V2Z2U2_9ACTN|nr:SGNH/GDSL hydrolase family protein [Jiangella asiatica]TDE09268.1 GDSL family lipase [Jiangella asiatica]